MPKLVAYRILRPALRLPAPVRVVCREDRPERLLAELAVQDLDVVLADAPAGPGVKVRVFHHPLGECGVSFFYAIALDRKLTHPAVVAICESARDRLFAE